MTQRIEHSMERLLITGASSGIGEAAALLLARTFNVTATVRTDEARSALLAKANEAGVTLDVALLEITSAAEVTALIQRVEDDGGIDVLVHNAGMGYVGTLEQLPDSLLREAMEVNFFGAAHTVKSVLPGMRRRGRGRVIAISSVGGAVGQPFNDAYCAAKFALEGLLESLAPVAATVGISISLIEPGPVATKFISNVKGLDHVFAGDPDDPFAVAKANYMARLGTPERMSGMQSSEDVAEVIAHVVRAKSPQLRYQTSEWSEQFVATKLSDTSGSATVAMTTSWVAADH
jgi:NAD(P)-dependent dehydrogenase (short-subunit alcohol dehydrogenase family)